MWNYLNTTPDERREQRHAGKAEYAEMFQRSCTLYRQASIGRVDLGKGGICEASTLIY
jgi:hypothetical protein